MGAELKPSLVELFLHPLRQGGIVFKRIYILCVMQLSLSSAWGAFSRAPASSFHAPTRHALKSRVVDAPTAVTEEEENARHWAYVMAQIVGCDDFKSRAWALGKQLAHEGKGSIGEDGETFRKYLEMALEDRAPHA